MASKPVSPEHALLTGMVLGVALRQGVEAVPVIDDDGDYTDTLEIALNTPGGPNGVRVFVVVQPPAAEGREQA